MEHALVVLEDTPASKALVREAGSYATAEDATLSILVLVTEDEVERSVSTLETIGQVENTSYGTETALKGALAFVDEVAAEAFDGLDVEYERLCEVVETSDRAEVTLDVAREHGCDHIFTTGRKRSPTGKALFGDFVQSLVLSFDGRVTVDLQ
ncbi:universal stress protein [Haloarchaeobius amylolyticus]|uniref:universal stress protein n=1 Tax=Haloarchaeobius amylolyticus TaxID=1198296 RepID=UPI0022708ECB|nr:universal stress protein [Haloarchaeobius amylolyticus]